MVSLCLYRYSCGVEWTLLGIFIVIVLGLNGALLTLMMFQNYWLLKIAFGSKIMINVTFHQLMLLNRIKATLTFYITINIKLL